MVVKDLCMAACIRACITLHILSQPIVLVMVGRYYQQLRLRLLTTNHEKRHRIKGGMRVLHSTIFTPIGI